MPESNTHSTSWWYRFRLALRPPMVQYADIVETENRILRRAIEEVLAGDVTFIQERILSQALVEADHVGL